MRTSIIASLCVVLAASMGHARAQSINIDVDVGQGSGAGAPSSTFAAAGQSGTWNAVDFSMMATPLVDLGGAATNATVTLESTGSLFAYDNPATMGDDGLLLDDLLDTGNLSICTISHLAAGQYTVFTYAWAPDNPGYVTGVRVNFNAPSQIGGAFTGTYVPGVTHAVDSTVVPQNGTIRIELTLISGFGSFNGVQIVRQAPGTSVTLCPPGPGGFHPVCPCTSGALGHGCPNSVDPNGALLVSSGTASIAADTLVLTGSGMPTTGTCRFFQGTTPIASTVFGDGLNCLGGTLTRLASHTNAGGASVYPTGAEASISVRGGATPGAALGYQIYYRDVGTYCNAATVNMTNGLFFIWAP